MIYTDLLLTRIVRRRVYGKYPTSQLYPKHNKAKDSKFMVILFSFTNQNNRLVVIDMYKL